MAQRRVLITGCSSGFGRNLVRDFLDRGWSVLATLRRLEERRDCFKEDLDKYGERLQLMELDVTKPDERAAVVELVRIAILQRGECSDYRRHHFS